MEQSEYDTLLAFCCDCKYPPECSKNEKDCIRRRAKNFIVKEGLLFHRDKHNKEYRVVTKKEKMKVLDGCHSAELGGGHFGRDKTLLKISERFYWIGMVNDVKEYCKTCEKCQKANGKFDKFSAELHPIPVKDEEWHTIGVDLIGPLPETQKGNKYIMTVSCARFTYHYTLKFYTKQKTHTPRQKVDVGVEDEEQQTSNVQDQVDADDVDKQREETILPSLQKSSPLHTLKSVDKEDSTIQLDEQPSVSNKKLPPVFDTAVLEDPNGWLDDEHITAAQHLLQEQHPDVAGLQSTSLQYTRTFEVHRDHPFIQCLHENGNHWITVSTVGCSSDMLQASKDSIVLEYIKMQEQSGASDCGLFAIATATAICNGQDLCMLEFDQFLMRKHLLQCFQNGAVLPLSG
ncbi:hypothetical protein EMCRGX_G033410 [Ephydatia muelleri]